MTDFSSEVNSMATQDDWEVSTRRRCRHSSMKRLIIWVTDGLVRVVAAMAMGMRTGLGRLLYTGEVWRDDLLVSFSASSASLK